MTATPATVNDYSIAAIAPNTQSVPAGVPATYTLQVHPPDGAYPGKRHPRMRYSTDGRKCNIQQCYNSNLTSGGAVNRTLVLTTTARTTTTTRLWQNSGPSTRYIAAHIWADTSWCRGIPQEVTQKVLANDFGFRRVFRIGALTGRLRWE